MRLAVIVANISQSAGGLYYSVRALAQGAYKIEENTVGVFAMGEYSEDVFSHWAPVVPQTYPTIGPKSYGLAPRMLAAIHLFKPDIIHVHGLWMYSNLVAFKVAKKMDCALVLSPRGMLDRWALQNSVWKKKLMSIYQENRALRRVDCFHALNQSEYDSIRELGYKQPICVLPNGTDLPEDWHQFDAGLVKEKKRIVFIGRLHPKKGIPNLLYAWSNLTKSNASVSQEWVLDIYGWDDGDHLNSYQKLAQKLGVDKTINWPGSVYGEEKAAVLRGADAFILPSFSEGLPMSVVEAWSFGLPVLMTQACNLPEGFACGGAIEMEPTDEGTQRGLESLIELPDADRLAMGVRGRELVESRFTWDRQVDQLQVAYRWLIGEAERPAWVK